MDPGGQLLTKTKSSWEITTELRGILVNRDHEVADVQGQTQKQQETFTPKEFAKAVYCHPAYLTYMQST